MAVIAVCVLVFVLQTADPSITEKILFDPGAARQEPWRFVTAAFAHGGIAHILFNMAALWMVGGQYLEQLLGRARFAAVYLVSAVGGSVVYMLFESPREIPYAPPYEQFWGQGTVGASGAVFGLFGAFLVLNRHLGRSSAGMYGTLLVNAVIGFVIPNIAWQAHLGGFLTGAAAAGLVAGLNAPAARRWQLPALVGLVAVLIAVALWKYSLYPAPLPARFPVG
jgi:membrane associated rhomboid family serine protease